jgi:triosephosphate isomerase
MLPLIVGNWKMNKTAAEARLLAQALARELAGLRSAEVVVCPPFTALPAVASAIQGSGIGLGAQNMHHEKSGAFTGEISGVSLKELGCTHVILGHSERRQFFGETDELVRRKVGAALEVGLVPIVCIGETRAERESGRTFDRLAAQFLDSVAPTVHESTVIALAYEPVWAIGSDCAATPDQVVEVHRFLRELAARHCGQPWAESLRILYGGSVTPGNAAQLMARREINGVLVGGASLGPDFARIARFRASA